MELTKNDIEEIALLARVGVNEQEIISYQKDLSSVLQYFEKLQEVDTDNVEEIGHITGMTNVYREDKVIECRDEIKQKIMENVPNVQDGYIKVKSVL